MIAHDNTLKLVFRTDRKMHVAVTRLLHNVFQLVTVRVLSSKRGKTHCPVPQRHNGIG
jgi:hypothetical protein